MQTNPAARDPAKAKPLTDEADIGSGEKTPGQLDTEKLIKDIPPLKHGDEEDGDEAGGPPDRPQ